MKTMFYLKEKYGDILLAYIGLNQYVKSLSYPEIIFATSSKHKEILPLLPNIVPKMHFPTSALAKEFCQKQGIEFINLNINTLYWYKQKKHLAELYAQKFNITTLTPVPLRLNLPLMPKFMQNIYSDSCIITICTSAGWPFKIWPIENFSRLVNEILMAYPHSKIVQVGLPSDPVLDCKLPNFIRTNNSSSLTKMITFVAKSNIFIGFDSLFFHVADIHKVSSVIMWFCTSPVTAGNLYNKTYNIEAKRYKSCTYPCHSQKCKHAQPCIKRMKYKYVSQIIMQAIKHRSNVKPKYSVIIVTYVNEGNLEKNKTHLYSCMESIKKNTLSNYEIIIFDNNSHPEFKQNLQRVSKKYDKVEVIYGSKNYGYAKANNRAVNFATGKYLIFLNLDVTINQLVTPNHDWLKQLSSVLSASVVLSGPSLVNCATLQSSYIEFWCAMIKKNIFLALGKMDERYRIAYCEDNDFCQTILSQGFKFIATKIPITHHHSRNIQEDEIAKQLTAKNRRKFLEKWTK